MILLSMEELILLSHGGTDYEHKGKVGEARILFGDRDYG